MRSAHRLSFLLTPRWIALTLVCLLALPGFKALSDWQWRRLAQRQGFNASVQANLAAPAADLTTLLPTGAQPDIALAWRTVRACGTWHPEGQVLVRRTSLAATAGFWVATPLVVDGRDLMVVRGWVPAGQSSMDTPAVPAPPMSAVCITARVRIAPPRTRAEPNDVPVGQVDQLEPGYYVEMVTSDPDSAVGLTLWPAPELTEGPHRSYALQWLIFATMTMIGWGILVRGELQLSGRG